VVSDRYDPISLVLGASLKRHVGWRSDQRECELSGIRVKMVAAYGSDQ
jgi:hypothetical protein